MKRFFKTMLSKFVKIRVITSATNVTKVDFKNPDNQHDDDNLAVGMGVRQYLSSNPDIDSKAVETFFKSAREFYIELAEQVVQKFPFDDTILQTLAFLNPDLRGDVSAVSVAQLSDRFTPGLASQKVEDEFQDLCLAEENELPTFNYGMTSVGSYWHDIYKITIRTGQKRFPNLCVLAFACLSLSHSNADTKRLFSRLRKVQSDYRGQLKQKTLENLLAIKENMDSPCYSFVPTENMLKSAKRACVAYNEQCRSDEALM